MRGNLLGEQSMSQREHRESAKAHGPFYDQSEVESAWASLTPQERADIESERDTKETTESLKDWGK